MLASLYHMEARERALQQEIAFVRQEIAAVGAEMRGSVARPQTVALDNRDELLGAVSSLRESNKELQTLVSGEVRDFAHGILAQISNLERRQVDHMLSAREQMANLFSRQLSRATRLPRRAALHDPEAVLERLAQEYPIAFPLWRQAFENGRKEYFSASSVDSLSIKGNAGSEAFRKFLAVYTFGRILDVGCGPQSLPLYLEGCDIEYLAGIDPLAGSGERKFEFVRGYAESLPWPDQEFDTVIFATSLDHVLSLEQALSEARRVLVPGGKCVVWVGFVPGAQPYDPQDKALKPIDAYHLFHFDRDWFLRLMTQYFSLKEEFLLDFSSRFYAFERD